MALNTALSIDVYFFDSVGNQFVRKETIGIPLPAQFVPCSPGPDGQMSVYSKILYGTNFQQEAYVAQTVSELAVLVNT